MIKFILVSDHARERNAYADTIPRIDEEILMTVVGERVRATVYMVLYDLDAKITKVFVR